MVANIPAGYDLLKEINHHIDEDCTDLSEAADLYVDKFGENGLFKLLTSLYTACAITETQKKICQYRWKEIYTTNFDNVLELCCSQQGVKYSNYTPLKRPSDVDYQNLPIIHINGCIVGTNFRDFLKEIKLTNTQYFSDDFSRSTWGERFRNDIVTSPCIVFAGYSLYDIDVARVLNTFEGMHNRIFFIISSNTKRSTIKKLEKYGTVLDIGIEGLCQAISDINAETPQDNDVYFSAWEQVSIPKSAIEPPSDTDITSFLMTGVVKDDVFAADVIGRHYNISISRTVSDEIVSLIEKGRLKNAMITANTGNGKSIILDSISCKLASKNIRVFFAKSRTSSLLKEIPLFRNLEGPIVFIIDNYFSHLEVIRALRAMGRSDTYILTTARTSQYELQEGEIRSLFSNQIENFHVDELDAKEITNLIDFLDKYALWGERQSHSMEQKRRFIIQDCSKELRFVILDLLESPNISQKIRDLIKFDGGPEIEDRLRAILIISQLLNLANIPADLALIGEMVHFDARDYITQHEPKIRDFSLIHRGRISVRSSVFSQYVLKNLIDTAYVIEVMTECMRQLDIVFDNDPLYEDVFKQFSRFRFIETAIAIEKRRIHMVKYFENIKEFVHCRANSLFWLQYAMCRISLNQYSEASRLFDVAFSYSKKSGYSENRHLDNQFARFLLESRTNSNEYTDYGSAFNKAHAICVKQMHDEPNSYNPFRVAINYHAFTDRRISQLSQSDLISIMRSCSEVSRFLVKAKNRISNTRVIEECEVKINKTAALLKVKLNDLAINV